MARKHTADRLGKPVQRHTLPGVGEKTIPTLEQVVQETLQSVPPQELESHLRQAKERPSLLPPSVKRLLEYARAKDSQYQQNEQARKELEKEKNNLETLYADLATRHARLEQELKSSENRATQAFKQARTDPLTGIGNRLALQEFVQQIYEILNLRPTGGQTYNRRNTNPNTVGFLLIDVDHFKNINDTYSHATGDLVLKTVAQTLAHNIRGTDKIFRYGGEEFAIIAQQHRSVRDNEKKLDAGLYAYGERLRTSVFREKIKIPDQSRPINISISVGVTRHNEGDTFPTLLGKADEALYCSKNAGRNRTTTYYRSLNDYTPDDQ